MCGRKDLFRMRSEASAVFSQYTMMWSRMSRGGQFASGRFGVPDLEEEMKWIATSCIDSNAYDKQSKGFNVTFYLHPCVYTKAIVSSLFAGMWRSISEEIPATRRPNNNEDDNDT